MLPSLRTLVPSLVPSLALGAALTGLLAVGAQAQINRPGPAPAAETELGPVVGDGKIIVRAKQMRVGQKMAVSFQDFPETGEGDIVQVVAAGAPDNVHPNSAGEKPLSFTYLSKWQVESGWEIGPFAPGLYEIRWLTTLYNNERKLEVGARAQFSVTR